MTTATIEGWITTRMLTGRTLLAISGRHVDFAPADHPGWRAFLDRVAKSRGVHTVNTPVGLTRQVDGVASRILDESGVGSLPMDGPTARYLATPEGIADLIAEGIALADPEMDRCEASAEVRGVDCNEFRRLRVFRLG